jgi:hypothetical protein
MKDHPEILTKIIEHKKKKGDQEEDPDNDQHKCQSIGCIPGFSKSPGGKAENDNQCQSCFFHIFLFFRGMDLRYLQITELTVIPDDIHGSEFFDKNNKINQNNE